MSDIAIKVENLSKKYLIDHNQRPNDNFREMLINKAKLINFFAKNNHTSSALKEEFWALQDIDFEINKGDRVGIIGRNGAGKSTLLKVLSRITEPTTGKIHTNGRIASLLEVGTGFHPELTGRENIYLNGAILGMSRAEIKRSFDEIVAFSEVEKFLDTPVKRYSSGMYVRLAFAVAAHLEPEILVVDEVLAVGDAMFQKKCLGKMDDASKEGRTVLFVSHNISAIRALCNKAIVLKNGSVVFDGAVEDGINVYLNESRSSFKDPVKLVDVKRSSACTLKAKIIDINLITDRGDYVREMDSTQPFKVRFTVQSFAGANNCHPSIIIKNGDQNILWFQAGAVFQKHYDLKANEVYVFDCYVDAPFLTSGDYSLDVTLQVPNQELIDSIDNAYSFSVLNFDPNSTGYNITDKNCTYFVNHSWSEKSLGSTY